MIMDRHKIPQKSFTLMLYLGLQIKKRKKVTVTTFTPVTALQKAQQINVCSLLPKTKQNVRVGFASHYQTTNRFMLAVLSIPTCVQGFESNIQLSENQFMNII